MPALRLSIPPRALILLAAVFLTAGWPVPGRAEPAAIRPDRDVANRAMIQAQFERFDPNYRENRRYYTRRMAEVAELLAAAEADGADLHCSQQMYLEAKWLHRYTALWDRLDDKIRRIELSLENRDQRFAAEQSPVDGHWGICYEALFMRLGATVAGLQTLVDRGEQPRYRLRSLGELDTPKRLLDRMQSLLISDIATTGIDHRGELASLMISLSQSVFKQHLSAMWVNSVDLRTAARLNAIAEAFRFFLTGAQDSETGWWGAWYLDGDRIVKTADLSMTYHIVAYTKGGVERWPALIATLRAREDVAYPYGWRARGKWNNHNLYDVARILRYGWPALSEDDRDWARAKLREMIEWSLANTLEEGGGFKREIGFSDSLASAQYFGVSFLDAVGLWRAETRFWDDPPHPAHADLRAALDAQGPELCDDIAGALEGMGRSSWAVDAAMLKLERNCDSDETAALP